MDFIPTQRRKKSDKARDKFEFNGGKTTKHIRLYEARIERYTTKNETKKKR